MVIKIASTAFAEGEMIPKKYTCDGDDISPPLQISDVPENTKSLALIMDDPDAPVGVWDHWIAFNIPASISQINEGEEPQGTPGKNSWGRTVYGGPCPPSGTHRYFFKLYALDTMLDLEPGASKKKVLKAMEGHILAQGELMGKYKR